MEYKAFLVRMNSSPSINLALIGLTLFLLSIILWGFHIPDNICLITTVAAIIMILMGTISDKKGTLFVVDNKTLVITSKGIEIDSKAYLFTQITDLQFYYDSFYSQFKLTNKNLVIGRPYKNMEATLLGTHYSSEDFYFVFYDNGFVLHNSMKPQNPKDKNPGELDYSKIFSEDVGSYITRGDTIFWGTKAGYMKKYAYYSAIITGKGLQILSGPSNYKINFLTLQ